jgi:hypothetical protein
MVLLPLLDIAILFLLHRVLSSRALRVAWSLLVILGLLAVVGYLVASYWMAVANLTEGLSR